MRLKFNKKTDKKVISRLKKKIRIRKKISGSSEKPRLCVYRSNYHIYAQVIDDSKASTILATSTLDLNQNSLNLESAKLVGNEIAKRCLEKNIKKVVFDRNGYLFHGRIKALADGAREKGLDF